MRILFTRSGGFAGLTRRVELDLTRLPPAERAALAVLVEESGFFGLAASYRTPGARDVFVDTLTIEDGSLRHTVTADERAAPAALRPLLAELASRV